MASIASPALGMASIAGPALSVASIAGLATLRCAGMASDSYWTQGLKNRDRDVRLGRTLRTSRKLYVKIEFVTNLRAGCAGVFDDRIFLYPNPRPLEPHHRRLVRWNGLGKYYVFPLELRVISKLSIEVEPCPAFTVAFASQPFQYYHIGGGRRRFRSQLIHMRVLLEKSFFNVVFWCSHDNLLAHLLKELLNYPFLILPHRTPVRK